jgi:hypothetical protein
MVMVLLPLLQIFPPQIYRNAPYDDVDALPAEAVSITLSETLLSETFLSSPFS